MELSELRASLLTRLGVTITEDPFEVAGERGVKTVITAPRALEAPLTDWLDVTHTGRLVELTIRENAAA